MWPPLVKEPRAHAVAAQPVRRHSGRSGRRHHHTDVIATMEPNPALLPLPTLASPVLASPPDRRLRWPRQKSPANGASAEVLSSNRENLSLTYHRNTRAWERRGRSRRRETREPAQSCHVMSSLLPPKHGDNDGRHILRNQTWRYAHDKYSDAVAVVSGERHNRNMPCY